MRLKLCPITDLGIIYLLLSAGSGGRARLRSSTSDIARGVDAAAFRRSLVARTSRR
jgi:hypothetical protein